LCSRRLRDWQGTSALGCRFRQGDVDNEQETRQGQGNNPLESSCESKKRT